MAKDQDDRAFVGVDLGGTNIQAGVIGAKDKLLATEKVKTKPDEGSDAVVKRIAKAVREALDHAGVAIADVGGLGIGAPGTIDIDRGIVLNATNLRWNKFPLAKQLGDELKLPVTLDNDVNVGTWAEHVAGAGKDYDDLLGVFVGTGIGGGLVLGGKLYHGHFLTAGEIGHTILHADAPIGRRTLENCASRTAVVNWLTQLIMANQPSALAEIAGGDLGNVRSKALAEAVANEDPLTLEVLRRAAHYVAVAIANVATMLSLPCVVLGGGLTEALGKVWVDWVRSAFARVVFPPDLDCKIVAGKLGDDAGLLGAALLARERLA